MKTTSEKVVSICRDLSDQGITTTRTLEVLLSLESEPFTVPELGERLGYDWATLRSTLYRLEDLGFVTSQSTPKKSKNGTHITFTPAPAVEKIKQSFNQ